MPKGSRAEEQRGDCCKSYTRAFTCCPLAESRRGAVPLLPQRGRKDFQGLQGWEGPFRSQAAHFWKAANSPALAAFLKSFQQITAATAKSCLITNAKAGRDSEPSSPRPAELPFVFASTKAMLWAGAGRGCPQEANPTQQAQREKHRVLPQR